MVRDKYGAGERGRPTDENVGKVGGCCRVDCVCKTGGAGDDEGAEDTNDDAGDGGVIGEAWHAGDTGGRAARTICQWRAC